MDVSFMADDFHNVHTFAERDVQLYVRNLTDMVAASCPKNWIVQLKSTSPPHVMKMSHKVHLYTFSGARFWFISVFCVTPGDFQHMPIL